MDIVNVVDIRHAVEVVYSRFNRYSKCSRYTTHIISSI